MLKSAETNSFKTKPHLRVLILKSCTCKVKHFWPQEGFNFYDNTSFLLLIAFTFGSDIALNNHHRHKSTQLFIANAKILGRIWVAAQLN